MPTKWCDSKSQFGLLNKGYVAESPRTLSKSDAPAFNGHDHTDIQMYNCSAQQNILAVFN